MIANSKSPDPADNPGAKPRSSDDTDRETRILKRAAEMPVSARNSYLRAARGKASPRAAIKAFCLECVGCDRAAIAGCTATCCPLFLYRPFQEPGPTDAADTEWQSASEESTGRGIRMDPGDKPTGDSVAIHEAGSVVADDGQLALFASSASDPREDFR